MSNTQKPFDLKAALAGAPVATREGKKVIELHRMKCAAADQMGVIVVYEDKTIQRYRDDGYWIRGMGGSSRDLVMVPEVRFQLVWKDGNDKLYLGSVHTNKASAEQAAQANIGTGSAQQLVSIVEFTV